MSQRSTEPAIELVNVSRRFITPDGKSMTALRNFNMTVARGEFVAVVGGGIDPLSVKTGGATLNPLPLPARV